MWEACWAEDKPGRPDVHFLQSHAHTQLHAFRVTFTHAPIKLQRLKSLRHAATEGYNIHTAGLSFSSIPLSDLGNAIEEVIISDKPLTLCFTN